MLCPPSAIAFLQKKEDWSRDKTCPFAAKKRKLKPFIFPKKAMFFLDVLKITHWF
jgi:hypothetical protein